jgi:hypothetical protein
LVRRSGWPWCATILALGKLFVIDEAEHRLAGYAHHRPDEMASDVSAVVFVLIVDDVAARPPERLSGSDDTLRLTFRSNSISPSSM